jgi:arsenite methyltransferase
MTEYLNYTFNDSKEFVETFDELPFWSASFGLLLLKHLELKPNITVIDIGSGAGFPVLELAGRLGKTCKLFGVDPWKNASERAEQKIKNYGLSNVEILDCSAEQMLFEDNFADLLVSNLGINNFENPDIVFKECFRVLKPGGKLAITTNVNGHWKEFYNIFEQTLKQMNRPDLLEALIKEQEHRGTLESITKLFANGGFKVKKHYMESFEMKFVDGSAFLNHYFVKLGWLSSWRRLFAENEVKDIFATLEYNLNVYAKKIGGLTLTVPMLYIGGEKNWY